MARRELRHLCIAGAALLVAACAPERGAEDGDRAGEERAIIGLITKTETNPYFVKMKEGAQAAANAEGVRLLTAAGRTDGDNAGQVTAMENMIVAGARVVLITANDAKAILPSVQKARQRGVLVIALDSPTDPPDATDALFATDNYEAGRLIGRYAKAALGGRAPKIATIDLFPGHPVGAQRHNGFLNGFGLTAPDARTNTLGAPPEVVCMADGYGNQSRGQAAMENCLQKAPGINVVYTINEPTAAGAYKALQAAGKDEGVILVSVDGSCQGVRDVGAGTIAATAQQYPLEMAALGVKAGAEFIRTGKKPSGYTNTGITLIADRPLPGVASADVQTGLQRCFGNP
jgi:fructose transport system substrate-binding protein